jgi:hypothetical protein
MAGGVAEVSGEGIAAIGSAMGEGAVGVLTGKGRATGAATRVVTGS